MRKYYLVFFAFLLVAFISCKKEALKSDNKDILSFILKDQIDSTKIDELNHALIVPVSNSTNLKILCPSIIISENATIKPASGDTVDFSNGPVNYTITAQDHSTQIWQVNVNHFLTNLSQKSISSIIVDSSNTKWIGTDSGLYKSFKNGYLLENISIHGKVLSVYYEKNSKTLWIGTDDGLFKLIIIGYNIEVTIIPSSNLSNQSVKTTYVDSSSRRWFGSWKGLSLNKDDIWKKNNFRINTLNKIFPADFEKDLIYSVSSWNGDYYFATNHKIFRAFGFNENVDAFTGATQWESPENGKNISDTMFVVFVDSKGKQWMGGTNGVQFHTGHDPKSNNTSFITELPNLYIHAIAEAPDGKIWIGTEGGLAKYDGTNWSIVTTGLPNPFITAIAFDKNGSAWVGTKQGLLNIK